MNMASHANSIFVDSCQYTPIYFVENPSITQANSYVVTQNAQEIQKPVSDNLKKFYENSGKLETNLCTNESSPKPRILKRADNNQVGNKLKLASFLLPKPEHNVCGSQMTVHASNVLLKPVYIANTPQLPNNNAQSKVVQLKEMTNVRRTPNGKIVPKTKPKDNVTNSKHTSVQLLKLGDSYHSLNRLSEEQMKIVNQALKIFNNPKEVPQKPKYDPVTNTKFIYKVVSSKDVAVMGDNNLVFAPNKPECVKTKLLPAQKKQESLSKNGLVLTKSPLEPIIKQGKLVTQKSVEHLGKNMLLLRPKEENINNGRLVAQIEPVRATNLLLGQEKTELKPKKYNLLPKKPENVVKGKSLLNMKPSQVKTDCRKTDVKRKVERDDDLCETSSNIPIFLENAVTRSGRKVRISRYILQDTMDKPKKKVSYVASCPHCALKFSSAYKLQRHYEFNPTHSPEKVHASLFQCLVSIVKGSKENGANVFVEQLEQFVSKLRSCLPCLIQEDDGADSSLINNDISRLLGISPGQYKIKTDGLGCEKDQHGHCKHCPPEQRVHAASSWHIPCPEPAPSQPAGDVKEAAKHNEIKLPNKRNEIRTTSKEPNMNAKKVKINPTEEASSMTVDDIKALLCDSVTTASVTETNSKDTNGNVKEVTKSHKVYERPKPSHVQFRSTHFDIRSSPIKTSACTFSKFQINTENMSQFKTHVMQPLELSQMCNNKSTVNMNALPKQLFNDSVDKEIQIIEQSSEIVPNTWPSDKTDVNIVSDSILENTAIKPDLIHSRDTSGPSQLYNAGHEIISDQILTESDSTIDALDFLESLGNECIYAETEIRNNSIDFHLDLF